MGSKRFQDVIGLILKHEGGYIDHPDDPGKETNYGISANAYPDLDIENLTEEDAREIYYEDYWKPARCDEVPKGLDLMLFDAAVNHGVGGAVRILQRAIGETVDGSFGPKTMSGVVSQSPAQLVQEYAARRMHFYGQLDTFGSFGLGWSRRLMDVYKYSLFDVEV